MPSPGPVRHFQTRLDELPSGQPSDMDMVGRALVELAADKEFFAPLIAQIPSSDPPGVRWLVRPERGPGSSWSTGLRGVAYTHSHRCCVRASPRSAAWRPISTGT